MLKVLFIDDQPSSVETVIEELKERMQDADCRVADFEDADTLLNAGFPDIVVLDIFMGRPSEGYRPGLDVYDFIWSRCFCPIVVYSAWASDISGRIEESHPFIKSVQKGVDSESQVISTIEAFRPHIDALNEVQRKLRQDANRELKSIAPSVFAAIAEPNLRKDVFVRAARRRIAAMMDEPYGGQVLCWEQYLYPPVGSNLLTGDIIRRKTADNSNPNNYYVVLSPSCDLVNSGGRTPNVANALVAQCTEIQNVGGEVGIDGNTGENRFKEKLLPLLRRGYGNFCLPMPALPEVFPQMTAELKKLELIEITKIGDAEGCEYSRVVSVDSPFREMIVWAYLQVAGRPGLPERDFGGWAEQIYQGTRQVGQGGNP